MMNILKTLPISQNDRSSLKGETILVNTFVMFPKALLYVIGDPCVVQAIAAFNYVHEILIVTHKRR